VRAGVAPTLSGLIGDAYQEHPVPPLWGLFAGLWFFSIGTFCVVQAVIAVRRSREEAESRGESATSLMRTIRELPSPLWSLMKLGFFLLGGLYLIADDIMRMAA
jgi:hypothetical protein